jgi:hypothetical protein
LATVRGLCLCGLPHAFRGSSRGRRVGARRTPALGWLPWGSACRSDQSRRADRPAVRR